MRTQNVTVAKLRREYWDRIQQGGKRFEIRNEPISDMSTMIVFEDADTGEHLGNARVLERHRFGPDATPWSWALLAQLGDTTVDELRELFPGTSPLDVFYVYRVEPVDDDGFFTSLIAAR